MKTNKISTKVKILGGLLIVATFSTIVISMYLNYQNKSDGLVVNIAGKQRMLSQKIAKNIFYIHATGTREFKQLQSAVKEFENGLDILRRGNDALKIPPAPTQEISMQLKIVQNLWDAYEKDVEEFITGIEQNDATMQQDAFEDIAQTNEELLAQMDEAVGLYSTHTAKKTEFIQKFQYAAFFVLFALIAFSILKLKQIEMHAREFMKKSKQLTQRDIKTPIEPMSVDAENEIEEVAHSLNHFIFKVNSAMELSNAALRQSKQASDKLEELTGEFNDIIGEVANKKGIGDSIDKSEDIMIQSSEEMVRTNKKLQELKAELDNVLKIFDQNQKT